MKQIRGSEIHWIAHRGYSQKEAENTASAFVAAGNLENCWGIETDVHTTSDGFFVLMHDDTTERTGDRNLVIEQSSYAQLCRVHLLDTGGQVGRRDLVIPLLKDYIDICRKYEKQSVLELKNPFAEKDIQRIIHLLEEGHQLQDTVFISFDLNNLKTLRKLLPTQRLEYLVEKEVPDDLLETLEKYQLSLDIEYVLLTKRFVEQVHVLGLDVNCWTVNDPEEAKALAAMGVDQITGNEPL